MNPENATPRAPQQDGPRPDAPVPSPPPEEAEPGFLSEFVEFLRENKKWWLIPMVCMFLIFAALAILVASSPAVMALIYPLI